MSPWHSIRIEPNGEYKFCDFSKESEDSDFLPSQWFSSGPLVTKARKNIQEGNTVVGCNQCYRASLTQFDSWRERKNRQAAVYHGQYFRESLEQSPAYERMKLITLGEKKPAFIHVSLSNLCNLSCRMCKATYSSKVADIHKKINIIPSDTPTLLDWTLNDEMWNDFLQNLVVNNSELVCLHFMGGEPLYHKKFLQLIKECVAQSKTDFHLTFVTNATIFPDELIELLSKFKSVSIEISVENLHPTNDYIRNGSNFQLIQKHILKLVQEKTQNISIILRSVPQALSIIHYDTLIDFAIEHKLCIDSNVLVDPRELSLDVLPWTAKQNIVKHLETKYSNFLEHQQNKFSVTNVRHQTNFLQHISHHIRRIIDLLLKPEPDDIEQLQIKFVRYNQSFDQQTDNTFEQCYPELAKYYEKYYNC